MFDSIINFFKKFSKENKDSKDTAKERLHLVLMQDRANVSADFLEMMKQEIIEVIKKYIDVDENSIDVKLTNKVNSDGTTGAPALYANIPITSLKDETKKLSIERKKEADSESKKMQQNEPVIAEKETKNEVNTESNENEELTNESEQKEIINDNKNKEIENKEEKEKKQEENDLSQKHKAENEQQKNNEIENKQTKSEEPKEEKKQE